MIEGQIEAYEPLSRPTETVDPVEQAQQKELQGLYTNLEDLVNQKRTESLTKLEQSLNATRNSVSQEEEEILAEIARELKQQTPKGQIVPQKSSQLTPSNHANPDPTPSKSTKTKLKETAVSRQPKKQVKEITQ